jgi:hypothetical protein
MPPFTDNAARSKKGSREAEARNLFGLNVVFHPMLEWPDTEGRQRNYRE